MSSMTGERVRISIFGQSHGEAIGVVVDGLPAGEAIDTEALQAFLARRAPGRGALSTPRREADVPRFLSGLVNGKTCGAPLCAILENGDTRPADYESLRRLPRPAHADYPAQARHHGHQDVRGGGHFSGRLTAPLCVAGGIAMQLLARRGVYVGAHLEAVGAARDSRFDPVALTRETLALPASRPLPVLEEAAGDAMASEIQAAAADGDSIGALIECGAVGMPPGVGEPMFGGMENRLSAIVFGIPGVRGIEFGTGFAAAFMRGSAHNDAYAVLDGRIVTESNHHGGILGGITTGMPIIFRVAAKPTPSIAQTQQTVNLETMEVEALQIRGRHDPCIGPRMVPCVEAAAALALLDGYLVFQA